ncbi:hypothetical protein DV713_20385 (plasmid) [Parageobacillus thermoglucosidasius]|uniref:Putative viral protein n=1 Tax=Geobacillus stearothermophilus TaxID=1422 RepID=B0VXN1_GEOSE|nr:hypothetical protein [Parageobacillus thermoglucosidasius]ACA01543.1 putative viral protein [Geobacillus stearothermophilus]RDE30529.1 hypothetical protein DV713_20385 [Parageobacillus thermoglucosidasius]
MKRILTVLMLFPLISACSAETQENNNTELSQAQANVLSVLEYHHSITIHQFSLILKEYVKNLNSPNSSNQSYLKGMADLYLKQNNLFIPNMYEEDNKGSNLSKEEQNRIQELYKNCRTFTSLISTSIDKNVPISADNKTIEELIKLADDIKSQNPYENGKIDLIVKMNQLIKEINNDNQYNETEQNE